MYAHDGSVQVGWVLPVGVPWARVTVGSAQVVTLRSLELVLPWALVAWTETEYAVLKPRPVMVCEPLPGQRPSNFCSPLNRIRQLTAPLFCPSTVKSAVTWPMPLARTSLSCTFAVVTGVALVRLGALRWSELIAVTDTSY